MPGQTVAAIGLTGNGKSTFCNRLQGSEVFAESDGTDGETLTTECRNGTFTVGKDSMALRVIDTPGLGDRDNRDSDHIKKMIDTFRSHKFVNVFLIAINYQSPRIDSNTKRLIQLLPAMLPVCSFIIENFFNQCCIIYYTG